MFGEFFLLFNLADRPRKKLIIKLNDLYYVFTFYSTSTPPKQWNCASPVPPARYTFPPYSPPPRPPVFGWLLHVQSLTGSHLRQWCILYFCFFFVTQFDTPNDGTVSPHRLLAQRASALTPPPTTSADYRVDCCLKSPNGGHLRPEPGAFLYFFVSPILTLQSTEPATARVHRTTRACFRPIGSGGAKI